MDNNSLIYQLPQEVLERICQLLPASNHTQDCLSLLRTSKAWYAPAVRELFSYVALENEEYAHGVLATLETDRKTLNGGLALTVRKLCLLVGEDLERNPLPPPPPQPITAANNTIAVNAHALQMHLLDLAAAGLNANLAELVPDLPPQLQQAVAIVQHQQTFQHQQLQQFQLQHAAQHQQQQHQHQHQHQHQQLQLPLPPIQPQGQQVPMQLQGQTLQAGGDGTTVPHTTPHSLANIVNNIPGNITIGPLTMAILAGQAANPVIGTGIPPNTPQLPLFADDSEDEEAEFGSDEEEADDLAWQDWLTAGNGINNAPGPGPGLPPVPPAVAVGAGIQTGAPLALPLIPQPPLHVQQFHQQQFNAAVNSALGITPTPTPAPGGPVPPPPFTHALVAPIAPLQPVPAPSTLSNVAADVTESTATDTPTETTSASLPSSSDDTLHATKAKGKDNKKIITPLGLSTALSILTQTTCVQALTLHLPAKVALADDVMDALCNLTLVRKLDLATKLSFTQFWRVLNSLTRLEELSVTGLVTGEGLDQDVLAHAMEGTTMHLRSLTFKRTDLSTQLFHSLVKCSKDSLTNLNLSGFVTSSRALFKQTLQVIGPSLKRLALQKVVFRGLQPTAQQANLLFLLDDLPKLCPMLEDLQVASDKLVSPVRFLTTVVPSLFLAQLELDYAWPLVAEKEILKMIKKLPAGRMETLSFGDKMTHLQTSKVQRACQEIGIVLLGTSASA